MNAIDCNTAFYTGCLALAIAVFGDGDRSARACLLAAEQIGSPALRSALASCFVIRLYCLIPAASENAETKA